MIEYAAQVLFLVVMVGVAIKVVKAMFGDK